MNQTAKHLLIIVELRKQIVDNYAPIKKKIKDALAEVNAAEKAHLAPVEAKEKELRAEVLRLADSPVKSLEGETLPDGREGDMMRAIGAISDAPELPKGVSVRRSWDYMVVDEKLIFPQFMTPDHKKIREEVRMSGAMAEDEVGGIEVFEKKTLVVRGA